MKAMSIARPTVVALILMGSAFIIPIAYADSSPNGSIQRIADETQWVTRALHEANETSVDRDVRVEGLHRVVALHPGSPQNLILEFRIGILLGQNNDLRHGKRPDELLSLPIFEGIVQHYDHKAYYTTNPGDDSDSPELMVPQAALLAASTRTGKLNDGKKARELLVIAMKDLQWTWEKRRADWIAAPKPAFNPIDESPEENARHIQIWEHRKHEAESGKVDMGPYGKAIMEAVVRQYGLSYGPQHPGEVPAVMREIITLVPDTPMAQIAQGHIALANGASVATRPSPDVETRPSPRGERSVPVIAEHRTSESFWLFVVLGACGTAILLLVAGAVGSRLRRKGHKS